MGILKALNVQPDHALAIFFMGELYLASDQPEKAGNQFKTAEKMFSGMGMVYWLKQAWAASGKL